MSCHLNCFPKQCVCVPARNTPARRNFQPIAPQLRFSITILCFHNLLLICVLFSRTVFLGCVRWPGKRQGVGARTPFPLVPPNNIRLNIFYCLDPLCVVQVPVCRFLNFILMPSARINECSCFALQGYTPLHIAALHGHRHIQELLTETYGK